MLRPPKTRKFPRTKHPSHEERTVHGNQRLEESFDESEVLGTRKSVLTQLGVKKNGAWGAPFARENSKAVQGREMGICAA